MNAMLYLKLGDKIRLEYDSGVALELGVPRTHMTEESC